MESWMYRLGGVTHTPDGRKHVINRLFDAAGDLRGRSLAMLRGRRDGGRPWVGDQVVAVCPEGQVIRWIVEECEGCGAVVFAGIACPDCQTVTGMREEA